MLIYHQLFASCISLVSVTNNKEYEKSDVPLNTITITISLSTRALMLIFNCKMYLSSYNFITNLRE